MAYRQESKQFVVPTVLPDGWSLSDYQYAKQTGRDPHARADAGEGEAAGGASAAPGGEWQTPEPASDADAARQAMVERRFGKQPAAGGGEAELDADAARVAMVEKKKNGWKATRPERTPRAPRPEPQGMPGSAQPAAGAASDNSAAAYEAMADRKNNAWKKRKGA